MHVIDNATGTCNTRAVMPRTVIRGVAVLLCVFAWPLLSATIAHAASSPKIVVIVEENKAYSAIVGSPNAPYINSLISSGTLFTNYSAITGGSLHDYLAMTSGLTTDQSPPAANVFQAIDQSGGLVKLDLVPGVDGQELWSRVEGRGSRHEREALHQGARPRLALPVERVLRSA